MYNCNIIRVEDGDTCYKAIRITARQPTGKYLYVPQAGDEIRMIIKCADGTEVITEKYICDGASSTIKINTDLPEGEYLYTIKLIMITGEIHTIIKDAKLIIE